MIYSSSLTRISQVILDAPMNIPRRKSSSSSATSLLAKRRQELLSSSSKLNATWPTLCSTESPGNRFESCMQNPLVSTSTLFLSADEFVSNSDFTLGCLDEASLSDHDEEQPREVRFAPLPTAITIQIMGLDDYTQDEFKSCWYNRCEIDRFRRNFDTNNRKKNTLCKTPEDRRWST